MVARRLAGEGQGRRGAQPGGAAQVQVDPPLLAVVVIGAHDHIGVAIPVHIPRRGHGLAEVVARGLAGERQRRRGAQPAGPAQVEVGPPLVAVVA